MRHRCRQLIDATTAHVADQLLQSPLKLVEGNDFKVMRIGLDGLNL